MKTSEWSARPGRASVVACLLCAAGTALSAPPTWQRAAGLPGLNENGIDMITLTAFGSYAIGDIYGQPGPFNRDALGQLLDPAGVLMQQLMLTTPFEDTGFGVTQLSQPLGGDVIWAIHTSMGEVDGHELALARLSLAGGLLWAYRYEGARFGQTGEGGAIKTLPNDDLVVAGSCRPAFTNGLSVGSLLRVNSWGAQIYNYGYVTFAGTPTTVDFADIVIDQTSPATEPTFLVAGTITALDGYQDALVTRIGEFGNVIWARQYDLFNPLIAPPNSAWDRGVALSLRPDGNIVVSVQGNYSGTAGSLQTGVMLLDASGNVLTSTGMDKFTAAVSATEPASGLDTVVAGSYRLGNGYTNAVMALFDSGLGMQWKFTYTQPSCSGEAVVMPGPSAAAPGFLLCGSVNTFDPIQANDTYYVNTVYAGRSYCLEDCGGTVFPIWAESKPIILEPFSLGELLLWHPELVHFPSQWYDLCRGCPADFNGDGFIDFTDFDDFVAAFESGDMCSDFNGDGFLDFTDFDAFVAAFEAGC